jgi:hypothetical protein
LTSLVVVGHCAITALKPNANFHAKRGPNIDVPKKTKNFLPSTNLTFSLTLSVDYSSPSLKKGNWKAGRQRDHSSHSLLLLFTILCFFSPINHITVPRHPRSWQILAIPFLRIHIIGNNT